MVKTRNQLQMWKTHKYMFIQIYAIEQPIGQKRKLKIKIYFNTNENITKTYREVHNDERLHNKMEDLRGLKMVAE